MSSEMTEGYPAPQQHPRGRPFAPGNPGRRPGSRNKITQLAAALLTEATPEIMRVLIEKAKAGDPTALKLLVPRMLPRQRAVEIELPQLNGSSDAVAALAAIHDAVATGQITPSEGTTLAALVEAYTRSINVYELMLRVETLEKKFNET